MISRTSRGLAGAGLVALAVGAMVCEPSWAAHGRDGGFRHASGFSRDGGAGHRGSFDHGHRHGGGHGRHFAHGRGVFVAPPVVGVRASHRRHRFGGSFVFIAPGPFYDPFFYPFGPRYYGYYPPAVVTVPSSPPVYIERAPLAGPRASAYWYWCSEPRGYYPAVQACPGGWQAVSPRPPTQQ